MKRLTLLEARKQSGLTQEELERLSRVDQSAISSLERGATLNPTYVTVRKLEAALKLKPGQLVFGREAMAS